MLCACSEKRKRSRRPRQKSRFLGLTRKRGLIENGVKLAPWALYVEKLGGDVWLSICDGWRLDYSQPSILSYFILSLIITIIINDNFYSALSKSSKALYNQGKKVKRADGIGRELDASAERKTCKSHPLPPPSPLLPNFFLTLGVLPHSLFFVLACLTPSLCSLFFALARNFVPRA